MGMGARAHQAPEGSVGCLSCLGLGELKEVPPSTELLGGPVPLAPAFQLTDAMIQGAVWPCQNPLPHRVTGCSRAMLDPMLEGTVCPSLDPHGVPVLGVAWGSQPCPVLPQACGTQSGWAGPRCCPTAP